MSTILLNLDFGEPSKKAFGGNAKHQRFVKKRRFLEQKGFLSKKNQPPSKVSKLNSEPPKKGETSRVDSISKILSCLKKKKEAAASKRDSEQSKDKKASLSWLTPAPSKKTDSVVAKIDLLGEFQSALPKPKRRTQKKGSKKPLKKKIATENSTQAQSKDKGSNKKPLKKNAVQDSTQAQPEDKCPTVPQSLPRKMVAIDCEMVGTGPKGRVSSLARCSIVNYNGDVLYDEYIRPPCYIVDYRTRWSGIRKCHMVNATPFKTARSQILKILSGKVVVGHAIHNDYKALQYFHPKSLTRDTSQIPLLNRKADCPENVTLSLKHLTKKLLSRDIQTGLSGHSSVEDAQATLELYKLVEVEWEQHLAQNPPEN